MDGGRSRSSGNEAVEEASSKSSSAGLETEVHDEQEAFRVRENCRINISSRRDRRQATRINVASGSKVNINWVIRHQIKINEVELTDGDQGQPGIISCRQQ